MGSSREAKETFAWGLGSKEAPRDILGFMTLGWFMILGFMTLGSCHLGLRQGLEGFLADKKVTTRLAPPVGHGLSTQFHCLIKTMKSRYIYHKNNEPSM